MCRTLTILLLFLGVVLPAGAQAPLPEVAGTEFVQLQEQCRRLLAALDKAPPFLSRETRAELQTLARLDVGTSADAVKLQKLLDAQCLIGVSINPESRVKAARGPAPSELVQDRESFVLIRVHNEAGVTNALMLSGPQLLTARPEEGRWLEATILGEPPLRKTLSGNKVDYVLARLRAREAGKREATLKFDVGQGTQDLGFRAEVPVLFTVRPAPPR